MKKILGQPVVQLALGIVALSLLPMFTTLPLERVTEIVVSTLYASGIILLVGYLGLTPFGGSIFYALAGYAAAIGMSSWLTGTNEFYGIGFAVLVCIVVALPVGALILRRRGLYFSLLTVACCQIMYEIAFAWTGVTGGENGIQNVPRPVLDTALKFHVFVACVTVGSFWLMWRIAHSPLGRLFQAIRDNEERAASLGYSVYRVKLSAFMIFAAITGLAGALMTFHIRGMYANSLSFEHAADPLMMSVLGGIFHPMGAFWGAAVFVVLEDQLGAIVQYWWLIFAPILMLVALSAPEGIHGLLARLFGKKHWTLVRSTIPARPDTIAPFQPEGEAVGGKAMVMDVRGLTKSFGSLVVASGYDFQAVQGEVHSFIGPNGAGKTTFFNMLSGLVTPNGGTVTFLGRDVTRLPIHLRSRLGISRSFQIVSVFTNLTAFENVRIAVQSTRPGGHSFWRDAYGNQELNMRVWSILAAVGLSDFAASRCSDLSHGERRLLDIALTLATNASVLLLDEPLAGLAEADRNRVASLIKMLGKTHAVVLIEHDIDRVLALSDRISVLHQGRIVATGAPADIADNADVKRAYLGEASAERQVQEPTLKDPTRCEALLDARGISAGYGGGRVIDGINLTVHAGEAIGILGRNGVGKTTLLRALYRLIPLDEGTVVWSGKDIVKLKPFEVNRLGLSIVPEGRRLFHNLTTLENLRVAARSGGMSIEEIFDLFPRLRTVQNSRAANLSGGERQMVAIARALVAPTSLILLDEPFEGLAPAVVHEVMRALIKLRGRVAMVLVEHHAEQVLSVAERAIVLVNGHIAWEGGAAELSANPELQARLLGLVDDAEKAPEKVGQHG